MKTIIFGNNEIKISKKPMIGKEIIIYNNILVPSKKTFGSCNNVFVAFEKEGYVQYDVKIRLRRRGFGFNTTVLRQQQLIYSDKKNYGLLFSNFMKELMAFNTSAQAAFIKSACAKVVSGG